MPHTVIPATPGDGKTSRCCCCTQALIRRGTTQSFTTQTFGVGAWSVLAGGWAVCDPCRADLEAGAPRLPGKARLAATQRPAGLDIDFDSGRRRGAFDSGRRRGATVLPEAPPDSALARAERARDRLRARAAAVAAPSLTRGAAASVARTDPTFDRAEFRARRAARHRKEDDNDA